MYNKTTSGETYIFAFDEMALVAALYFKNVIAMVKNPYNDRQMSSDGYITDYNNMYVLNKVKLQGIGGRSIDFVEQCALDRLSNHAIYKKNVVDNPRMIREIGRYFVYDALACGHYMDGQKTIPFYDFDPFFIKHFSRMFQIMAGKYFEQEHLDNSLGMFGAKEIENKLQISLESHKFVDPKFLSKDHVLEIRKNKDSLKKFRNYRIFIEEDFIGKSKSYIEDKLFQKTEEYEALCKSEGLKLKIGNLSYISPVTSSTATLAALTVSTLSGNNDFSLESINSIITGAGACSIIGESYLKVKQLENEVDNKKVNYPISYLFNLKEKLQKPIKT